MPDKFKAISAEWRIFTILGLFVWSLCLLFLFYLNVYIFQPQYSFRCLPIQRAFLWQVYFSGKIQMGGLAT